MKSVSSSEPPLSSPPNPAQHQGGRGSTSMPAAFLGNRKSLCALLLKNLFLTIITFGIYRFWAKTHLRAWLWRHLTLLGDRLDYIGTGVELFIGFLLAMVILFVLGTIFAVFDLLGAGVPIIMIGSNLLYIIGFICLIHIAIFRANRYRMTRTVWRGIRFGMDGDQWDYLKKGLLWTFLVIITLGFALPWAQTALLKYRVDRMRFGRSYFALSVNVSDLLIWWVAQYALIVLAILTFWFVSMTDSSDALVFGTVILVILFAAGLAFVNAGYRVNAINTFLKGASIGGIAFRSALPLWGTIWRAFACYLGLGLLVVAAFAVVKGNGGFDGGFEGIANFMTFVVVIILLGWTLTRVIYQLVMLPFVLSQLAMNFSIEDPAVLDQLVQGTKDAIQHGEGLMDGLDADGFDVLG